MTLTTAPVLPDAQAPTNGPVVRAVVVTSGVSYRRLGVPELQRLTGAGVYYGASISEAPGVAGEHAYVVGGGNSAGQAAMHLPDRPPLGRPVRESTEHPDMVPGAGGACPGIPQIGPGVRRAGQRRH